MARYYFLATALPTLVFGSSSEISFKELRSLIWMNFSHGDLEKFLCFLQPIDLYNVKAFWKGLPLDDRGTLSGKELEEALLIRENIPPYLIEFLERYESIPERLKAFPSLYASMVRQKCKGFLKFYFQLEREMRLVLTALRVKKAGVDLIKELQFEDPFDPFVAQILAQKDIPDYAPPSEYEDLKVLFVENSSDPTELMRVLMKYRFKKFEEFETAELFSADLVISYAARLLMMENWNSLDRERANAKVEELSKYG